MVEGEGWKGRGGRGGVEGGSRKRGVGGERDSKEGIGEVERRWRNDGNIAYTCQSFDLSV